MQGVVLVDGEPYFRVASSYCAEVGPMAQTLADGTEVKFAGMALGPVSEAGLPIAAETCRDCPYFERAE